MILSLRIYEQKEDVASFRMFLNNKRDLLKYN